MAVAPSNYAAELSEGGGLLGKLAKLQGLDDNFGTDRNRDDDVYDLEEGVEAEDTPGPGPGNDAEDAAPEDSTILKHNDVQEYLKKKTPEEAFAEFDTDGSGAIDFDEFKAIQI